METVEKDVIKGLGLSSLTNEDLSAIVFVSNKAHEIYSRTAIELKKYISKKSAPSAKTNYEYMVNAASAFDWLCKVAKQSLHTRHKNEH